MATFYELAPISSEHWPIFTCNNIPVNGKIISVYFEATKYFNFFLKYLVSSPPSLRSFIIFRIVRSLHSNLSDKSCGDES